jgi:hypothetical protein
MIPQFQFDIELFRQVTEQGGAFFGRHAGKLMSWERLKAETGMARKIFSLTLEFSI